jgi:ketosteroid isomerase-like protein
MTDDEQRVRNLAAIERALAALSKGDMAGYLAPFAEDAVFQLPFADPPVRLNGKQAIEAQMGPALEMLEFQLDMTKVYECADRDVLVLEYTNQGRVTTTGKPYRNSYIAIARFRDGRISSLREYFNPMEVARALTP